MAPKRSVKIPQKEQIFSVIDGFTPQQFLFLVQNRLAGIRRSGDPLKGRAYLERHYKDEKKFWICVCTARATRRSKLLLFVREMVHLAVCDAGLLLDKNEQYSPNPAVRKKLEKEAVKFFQENQRLVMETFMKF